MKILFFTHPVPNYMPDLLLHGLRSELGEEVVDYPRKDALYQGALGLAVASADQLCPGWFPEDKEMIDREDITGKIARGYFDLVISDLRALAVAPEKVLQTQGRLVLLDGEDKPLKSSIPGIPLFSRESGEVKGSIPLPMALPSEILVTMDKHRGEQKRYGLGFLGSVTALSRERQDFLQRVAEKLPDALMGTSGESTPGNEKPQGRLGRDHYYRSLQQCRYLLSLPGAGFDTFRFWENCGCNALHWAPNMPLTIPHDFTHDRNISRFDNLSQLLSGLEKLERDPGKSADLLAAQRAHLSRYHLTIHRARYLLEQCRKMGML